MFTRIKNRVKNELEETRVLLRNVPAAVFALLVASVIVMNLLASKALVNTSWIALDTGIIVAWLPFLTMDMLVKRFGPRAAIKLNIVAALINVLVMLMFTLAAIVPGDWGLNDYASGINWWIIGASTAAFVVSGIVNAFINWAVRKMFKNNKNGFTCFATSAYVSTMIAQFVDNLVFALIFTFPASLIGLWGMEAMTVLGLLMFAATGAIVELLCEVIFSPIGFKFVKKWDKLGVGKEYLDLIASRKENL